jgi:hypothetical protein
VGLTTLRGSGITLILDMGGMDAVRALASSVVAAAAKFNANVWVYYRYVLIRYVAIGNEVSTAEVSALHGAVLSITHLSVMELWLFQFASGVASRRVALWEPSPHQRLVTRLYLPRCLLWVFVVPRCSTFLQAV